MKSRGSFFISNKNIHAYLFHLEHSQQINFNPIAGGNNGI